MKKKVIIITGSVLLTLVVLFAIYLMADTDNHTPSDENEANSWEMPSDLIPVLSFGNQQQEELYYCAFDGDDIYVGESGTFFRRLVRFSVDAPTDIEKIYTKFQLFKYRPITQVAIFNHWIYFIEMGFDPGDAPSIYSLYRVKEGGGEKQFLSDFNINTYPKEKVPFILTEEAVLYNTDSGMYAISLSGGSSKKLPGEDCYLFGLDDGWIYYTRLGPDKDGEDSEYYTILHRMRMDGTKDEKVLDLTKAWGYIVDKGKEFYLVNNRNMTGYKVIMRTSEGKKTVLAECSNWTECLNKEGDWLYFGDGNELYKLNVVEKGEKQLVYSFPDEECYIKNIYLQDGDVFVVSNKEKTIFLTEEKKIYLKKDGTEIDFTNVLPEYKSYW
jgi:hypothetical protein